MTQDKTLHTCCFFGHRTINETEELKTQLYETIERLIVDENVDTFLFGTKIALDYVAQKGRAIIRLPVEMSDRNSNTFGNGIAIPTMQPTIWIVHILSR